MLRIGTIVWGRSGPNANPRKVPGPCAPWTVREVVDVVAALPDRLLFRPRGQADTHPPNAGTPSSYPNPHEGKSRGHRQRGRKPHVPGLDGVVASYNDGQAGPGSTHNWGEKYQDKGQKSGVEKETCSRRPRPASTTRRSAPPTPRSGCRKATFIPLIASDRHLGWRGPEVQKFEAVNRTESAAA